MRGVLAVWMLVGCYDPHPHAGSRCGPGNACPSPLVCSALTQTCQPGSDGLRTDAALVGTYGQPFDAAPGAPVTIFLTSGTTWTVPMDWTATNTIAVLGAGGGGAGTSESCGAQGGSGGGFSQITNVTL